MLVSLKIKNFHSIKNELILDIKKSYKNNIPELKNNSSQFNNIELLNSLILYGRNASGKSNILMAFRALQYLVKKSDNFKHNELIAPYEQFLFEKSVLSNPVEFEIEFFGENNIKYVYCIKFNEKQFIYESLSFYPKNVISKLYERKFNRFSYGEYYEGAKKDIEKNLLENQLFLSKSASQNIKYLKEAYLFFSKYLIVSTIHDSGYDRAMISSACEMMSNDELRKDNMKILISGADTNIIDIVFDKLDEKVLIFPENIPDTLKNQIMKDYLLTSKTLHNNFENGKKIGLTNLPLEAESLGTKKLIAVGGLIINILINGGVLIVDELDKSLHPLLTKMLIKLFHSKNNNPKKAQLIFATHDSSLLDTSLFGRDQICLVDKEYNGNTILYKLSDIKGIRKDVPFEKWYLSGRFSAIPVIADIQLKFK